MRDADTAYLVERTHSSVRNDSLADAVSQLQMDGSTPRLRQQAGSDWSTAEVPGKAWINCRSRLAGERVRSGATVLRVRLIRQQAGSYGCT